jgi:hypothetical protein
LSHGSGTSFLWEFEFNEKRRSPPGNNHFHNSFPIAALRLLMGYKKNRHLPPILTMNHINISAEARGIADMCQKIILNKNRLFSIYVAIYLGGYYEITKFVDYCSF